MVKQRVLFKDIYEVCGGSIYLMKLFLEECIIVRGVAGCVTYNIAGVYLQGTQLLPQKRFFAESGSPPVQLRDIL